MVNIMVWFVVPYENEMPLAPIERIYLLGLAAIGLTIMN